MHDHGVTGSHRAAGSGRAAQAAAPAFFFLLGGLMLLLAFTQPSWIDGRIGPGLFARWLAAAVMGMSAVWLIAAAVQNPTASGEAAPAGEERLLWRAGAGLLAAVASFALVLPYAGLVATCALTACVASWGAGERTIGAYSISAGAAATAALALGLTLLPPGIRLWPGDF